MSRVNKGKILKFPKKTQERRKFNWYELAASVLVLIIGFFLLLLTAALALKTGK